MDFIRQFLQCYDESDGKSAEEKVQWFLERTCMEITPSARSRVDAQTRLNPFMYGLFALERMYLDLGLDKLFPVRQSIKMANLEICHPKIPAAFDGMRLLWLSDLHLDVGRNQNTVSALCAAVQDSRPDMLIFGGDYRHGHGPFLSPSEKSVFLDLKKIKDAAKPGSCVALLGNHDLAEMVPYLEQAGAMVLSNHAVTLECAGAHMNLIGLDDSYRFFQEQSAQYLQSTIIPSQYNIVLSHNQHIADIASQNGADLFIAGHTHGGQLNWKPLRWLLQKFCGFDQKAQGQYQIGSMTGYTSTGIGSSAIPIRNVQSEALMITLRPAPTNG